MSYACTRGRQEVWGGMCVAGPWDGGRRAHFARPVLEVPGSCTAVGGVAMSRSKGIARCAVGSSTPVIAALAVLVIWTALVAVAVQIRRVERREFLREAALRVKLLDAVARTCWQYTPGRRGPTGHGSPLPPEGTQPNNLTQHLMSSSAREFPVFFYRQAMTKPFNSTSSLSPFEHRLIERFRTNRSLRSVHGAAAVGGQKFYYVARPIVVNKTCLACHEGRSQGAHAPRTHGGKADLNGWRLGELAGVRIVGVPVEEIVQGQARLRQAVWRTAGMVATFLSCTIGLLVIVLLRTNRRAQQLAAARARAEAASEAKTAFLATMSHEMRTPLNAIVGYAEELDASAREELLSEQAREAVRAIIAAGRHLRALISDILDLARIEAGRIEQRIERVGLPQVVLQVVAMMRRRAEERGLRLDVVVDGKVPSEVYTDPAHLRQILVNLVGNAVKFTLRGGITVKVAAQRKGSDVCELLFSVRDTGPGIPEHKLDQLFEPFVQLADDPQQRALGSGLGLNVTRRLVRAAGGTIRVHSQVGQGTTFDVCLPLRCVADCVWVGQEGFKRARTQGVPLRRGRPLQGIHVLVCEDNPLNARVLQRMLGRWGARTTLAENGAECVAYFRNTPADKWPQLILMDLQMPVMSGLEAARTLRAMGLRLPIVALTANVMKDDYARCMEAGFDAYLSKPIERAELQETILNYVRRPTQDSCDQEVGSAQGNESSESMTPTQIDG